MEDAEVQSFRTQKKPSPFTKNEREEVGRREKDSDKDYIQKIDIVEISR